MTARPGADANVPAPMPTAPYHNAAGRQCRRRYSQCREPFPGRSLTGRPLYPLPGCIVAATLPLCCRTLCTHAPDVCRFHRRSVVAIAVQSPVRQCTLPEPSTGSTTSCRKLLGLTAAGTLHLGYTAPGFSNIYLILPDFTTLPASGQSLVEV
jgi:hypothetical protein